MQKTNIVIDQTYRYSLGVNGLYAHAMGKLVFRNAESDKPESLQIKHSQVIDIKPSAKSIVDSIELLILKRNEIEDPELSSRK